MTETRRFAIAGVAGRMGRQLARAVLEAGHDITGGTEIPESPHLESDIARLAGLGHTLGEKPVTDPVEAATQAQVWVDFTAPAATLAALEALKHTSVQAVVIGTTGFSAQEEAQITAVAEHFAIVRAGNFSLGVNLLTALTRIVAARLGSEWDIEVLETHHRHKADAPSGTALMLGEAAAKGRADTLETLRREPYEGREARRGEGEIGFAVRRAGGIVGEHEVLFGSQSETVRLGHSALDRRVFAEGAVAAALWACGQPPGLYDMEDMLGLKGLGV